MKVRAAFSLKNIGTSNFDIDLTAANITFEMHNFDSSSKDELYSHSRNLKTEAILTSSGKPLSDPFPKYVVQLLSFLNCFTSYPQAFIRIIGFGISVYFDKPYVGVVHP